MKIFLTFLFLFLLPVFCFAQKQVGITDDFYLQVDSSQDIATEVLYTITKNSDSTQTQWMIGTKGELQFRKLDKELRLWTEWVKLPALRQIVPSNGKEIILNDSRYFIRPR